MSTDDINGSTYTPEPTGPNGTTQIGDDLSSDAKETLASYLSALTTNSYDGNTFPIDPDNPLTETSLRQDNGLPAEFTTGGNDETEGFTERLENPVNARGTAPAIPVFETLSGDTYNIDDEGIEILDKNSQAQGNFILTNVRSTQEANEPGVGNTSGQVEFPNATGATAMQRQISRVLKESNRFDSMPGMSPYISNVGGGVGFTAPGIPIEQGALGVYDPEASRTQIAALEKVAMSQLMRSTGHKMGAQDPSSPIGTVATTGVQKGRKKVSVAKLRAKNAAVAPERFDLPNFDLSFNDYDGSPLLEQKSFGNMSNPFEPFESGHPTNMAANITTAAEAFGEIAIAGAVFSIVMSLIQTVADATSIPTRPQNMRKGQYRKTQGTAKIMSRLGIPLTNRPFAVCVCYGIVQFFKLPISALPPIPGMGDPESDTVETWWTLVVDAIPTIIDAFLDVQLSHGYYATVMRVMRRDLQQLINELGSIPSDPASLFILIKEINTYASWRFFCTLAILGEKYLESINATYAIVPNINKMKNHGQSRQAKSRISSGQPELAWRHRASPAMVLLPSKLAGAYQLWGFRQNYAQEQMRAIGDNKTNSPGQPWNQFLQINGSNGTVAGTSKRNRRFAMLGPGMHRLPQDLVTTMEDELDSEYMPFYFHDLRTNELISFMAFIDDVKDSYSVNYSESAGYGRIDPVKIYSSTSRSISASFTFVATSPEDFDAMWWSINKLVSMLYPQFSMGKALKAGSGTGQKKFIMPFSQIPTASPVIRLRIGDVIRSNYSRFNLARLFGLSEGVAADPHSAGGTTIPADGVASDGRDFGAAPFDLTYQARAQAAIEDAEADAETESEAAELDIALTLSLEPMSNDDDLFGYWPGSEILGRAYLKANNEGYTTYDMDQDRSAPEGYEGAAYPAYAVGQWPTLFPPPTATSGINITSSPFLSRTTADGLVNILARRVSDENGDFNGSDTGTGAGATETSANAEVRAEGQYAEYLVSWVDPNDAADPYGPALSAKQHTHAYVVTSADLYPVPLPSPEVPAAADVNINLEQQVIDIYRFFQPKSNAIVRSFESAGGRGLAGVITSFDMDWGEAMWDMSGISRRAPTMCKISIAFSPIHDIVPGLDNNGAMRALNYPVGKVSSGLAEDWTTPGSGVPAAGSARLRPSIGAGSSIDDAGDPARDGFAQSRAKAFDQGGEGI